MENHYDYLDSNFKQFLECLGVVDKTAPSLIRSHGDKCYSYKDIFEQNGVKFGQGVSIYLLTHIHPYSLEVRETENGWVDPFKWIVDNKDRFLKYLP